MLVSRRVVSLKMCFVLLFFCVQGCVFGENVYFHSFFVIILMAESISHDFTRFVCSGFQK